MMARKDLNLAIGGIQELPHNHTCVFALSVEVATMEIQFNLRLRVKHV